nr:Krueppel-like factor 2 isoform X2 [Pan troglodytes]
MFSIPPRASRSSQTGGSAPISVSAPLPPDFTASPCPSFPAPGSRPLLGAGLDSVLRSSEGSALGGARDLASGGGLGNFSPPAATGGWEQGRRPRATAPQDFRRPEVMGAKRSREPGFRPSLPCLGPRVACVPAPPSGLPWNHLCNAAPSTLPQPHGAGAPVALCNCLFLCASAPLTLGALEGRARMLVNPVRTPSPEEPLGAYTAQACLHQVHGASTAQTG